MAIAGRFVAPAIAAALTLVSATACERAQANQRAPREQTVVWHSLGSWAGHGSQQTESFTSDTGALRVRWETSAASAAPPTFRLTAHSAISGRPLQQVVEHAGPGSGVGYVQQDPHVMYMVVDARDTNWKFT